LVVGIHIPRFESQRFLWTAASFPRGDNEVIESGIADGTQQQGVFTVIDQDLAATGRWRLELGQRIGADVALALSPFDAPLDGADSNNDISQDLKGLFALLDDLGRSAIKDAKLVELSLSVDPGSRQPEEKHVWLTSENEKSITNHHRHSSNPPQKGFHWFRLLGANNLCRFRVVARKRENRFAHSWAPSKST
jgi:hypothetical protein